MTVSKKVFINPMEGDTVLPLSSFRHYLRRSLRSNRSRSIFMQISPAFTLILQSSLRAFSLSPTRASHAEYRSEQATYHNAHRRRLDGDPPLDKDHR